METIFTEGITDTKQSPLRASNDVHASNDNDRLTAGSAHPTLPRDAVARIFQAARSVTSGGARKQDWRLVFERPLAPWVEPLTGLTGSDDPLAQVELRFPTQQAAVAYAERQGLAYVVQNDGRSGRDADERRLSRRKHAFSDATLDRIGLKPLQDSYGCALAQTSEDDASNRDQPTLGAAAMAIVNDPERSLDDKRSILMNWAWNKYLNDQATIEGASENDHTSRLREVELALLALEKQAAQAHAAEPKTPELARATQHAA